MSNHSIIEHRAYYHYIKLEEDYLAICSNGECSPHCKALILAILESWTNTKREKGESDYIYLTMPQWIKYTYMLYERNIITDCIKELLEEGLITRRQIIMFEQKTFEYKLMDEVINEHIKGLPPKESKEVLPRLDAYLVYKNAAKERAKVKRAEKKEQEGVREKSRTVGDNSPTPDLDEEVREKSITVGEKSQGVRDNSTGGYVINQRNLESITYPPLTSTHNNMSSDISVTHADETSKSKDTVSDGGNGSSDFQEVPSNQTPNSQALGEKIDALIQEADKPLPTQDEAPKNESEPQTEALPPNEEKTPSASCSQETTPKQTRKARSLKGKVSLTDTTPIPPPAKPSEDQLWTPLTCMQLADYYRGSVLGESNRKGSKYQRAVEAAIKLVNQQRKTYQEVDRVFRFMKCLDKYVPDGLWDEWWDGKDVDLWNVGDHCTGKLIEIERKKKERGMLAKPGQSNNSQQELLPSMTEIEASKLAQDAMTQAKAYGYCIQAQATLSKKVKDAWIVKVKWDNEDGFVVPPIKTREQWQQEFKSMHENLSIPVPTLAKREAK